jgi:ABC-2 type transport system permease protein
MKHVSNIIQLGLKELRSLWHEKILAFFILASFSIMIYSAATAQSRELHNAPIGIVDEDQSPLSARIISAFYGPYFKQPATDLDG